MGISQDPVFPVKLVISNATSGLNECSDPSFTAFGQSACEAGTTKCKSCLETSWFFILNSIISEVAELAKNEKPFPFYVSANMPNAKKHNQKLYKKFKRKNPHI